MHTGLKVMFTKYHKLYNQSPLANVVLKKNTYFKVANRSMIGLVPPPKIFRLLMKEKFYAYLLYLLRKS